MTLDMIARALVAVGALIFALGLALFSLALGVAVLGGEMMIYALLMIDVDRRPARRRNDS